MTTKRTAPKKVAVSKKAKAAEATKKKVVRKVPAKKVVKKKVVAKKPAKKVVAKKPAAKKAAAEPRATQLTQNGARRPKPGGKTAAVWEIADTLSGKAGGCPSRKDVLAACAAKDLNANMSAWQFQAWRKFNGHTKTK